MRLSRLFLALAAATLVAACGGNATDTDPDPAETAEAVAGSPDFDALALELAGDDGSTSDGTLESGLTADGVLASALSEDAPELLPAVRSTVKGINTLVARFVRRIEALVATAPSSATGATHTWTGTHGSLEYRFTMTRAVAKRYAFELSARVGSSGEFTRLLDGENIVGAVAHRGAGVVRCDLSALHALDASGFKASGKLEVLFAHTTNLKRLRVKLVDFKRHDEATAANAAYVFTSTGRGNTGAIKLALHANLNTEPEKAAEEWMLVRGRWLRSFAARFDAVAFGGDVPAGAWVRARECLAASADGRVAFKNVVYHPATGLPKVLREFGDVQACAPGLRADPPASELPESQASAEATSLSEAEVEAPSEN